MNQTKKTICLSLLVLSLGGVSGELNAQKKATITGSIQSDMMIAPLEDKSIGTETYDNKYFLTNTYATLNMQSKMVDAGVRFELTEWPMPGFHDANNDFKGWGLPNFWVKAKLKRTDITAGTFYEQFGSGFILRSYEERTLGIDNSLMGAHIATTPVNGLTLKVLSGLQRNYWDWWKTNKNLVSGADAEFSIEELAPRLRDNGTHLSIGGSWVNKYEDNATPYILMKDGGIDENGNSQINAFKVATPKFVNAFDARLNYQQKGFSVLAEYAMKMNDPNSLNSYTYGKGHAEMLSTSYARKGLSLLAQAKRSENMGFRSICAESPLSKAAYINHMPAFTVDQTYALAALYPYATQLEGEWAYQASIAYKIKGKYAPKLKLNASIVNGLENVTLGGNEALMATDWKKSDFFKQGDRYYTDIDFQYEHRLSNKYEQHFMIMYQDYNKEKIQNEVGAGNITSWIVVYEPKWKINKKLTLRGELQTLFTSHESDNWYFALAELSVAPYLMFTVSDQIGRCEPAPGEYGDFQHYYNFGVTANIKSHRLQLSFGRTRAGYNCNGGVCRYIPASKGVRLSYNYNF